MLTLGLNLGQVTHTRGQGGGVSYLPEAQALFARMTTEPDATRKGLINTLIGSLIAAGVWSRLDALYVMAAHDAQASRRNWIADQYNLTTANSPEFTVDRGYSGFGSAHLDTGLNPATASGARFLQNSGHLGSWARTEGGLDQVDIGARTSSTAAQSLVLPRSSGGTAIGRVNLNTGGTSSAVASAIGHTVASRTSSDTQAIYRNGGLLASATIASVAPASLSFFVCGCNQAGTPTLLSGRQISAAHIGGSLTAQNITDLYTALNTYLQAVGAT